jgi:hypothetical protein
VSFHTGADCGATALLLYYFDTAGLEHPIDVSRVREIAAGVISTWEDVAATVLLCRHATVF